MKERINSLVFLEAIVEGKMAGGKGRKPSDEAALGRERQRHLLQEQLHPMLTRFQRVPVIWREDSTHFEDTLEGKQLMGQHGWLGW